MDGLGFYLKHRKESSMSVKQWYDRVFGNNDGKFDLRDLPNKAVLIVGLVVDFVMLFAEYRVYSVGKYLTNNTLLALGFVAVSCLPFYLGQVAFLYNRANRWQQAISVSLVLMGLLVSAYYGFADFIFSTNTSINLGNYSIPIDANTLYMVAVSCTVALIIGGLLFVFLDDGFANTVKQNRIKGKAQLANQEIEIKRKLLADLKALRLDEEALAREYPEDYNALQSQFSKLVNPTNGNGKQK